MIITAGATNRSVYFRIVGDDSNASTGDPITGLLFSDFETGGSASYVRQGAARVDFTLVTLASASAAHTDGGFILVDDTNMPGLYRCDIPDAAFATGADQVILQLVAAAANNAIIEPLVVDITDFDTRIATQPVNVIQISGDTTAADNLELQYDTTGLTGDNFPATQEQIGRVSTSAGGLSLIASTFVLTTGTVSSGSITSTEQLDAVVHIIDDAAGDTEFYYEFDVGGDGTASEIVWNGYVQSNGDSAAVFGFDWVSSSFKQVGSITGSNGTTLVEEAFIFTNNMTGTGANQGLVRFRFLSTTSTAIATDRVLCSFAVISRSTGYSNGSIWIDSDTGNTNTENFVDGVADNPVSTLTAARVIGESLNLHHITFVASPTFTVNADFSKYFFTGVDTNLILSGSNSGPIRFEHGRLLTGTSTATTTMHLFDVGLVGAVDYAGLTTFTNCVFAGTGSFTPSNDGTLVIQNSSFLSGCFIDLVNLNSQEIYIEQSFGDCEVRTLTAGDVLFYSGTGTLTLAASCTGGTVNISGNVDFTNNGSGMTINSEALINNSTLRTELFETAMTESYAANGAAPTTTQALYAIHQMLQQFSITGTNLTVKKLDDTTTAFIVTLSDANNPTGNSRT